MLKTQLYKSSMIRNCVHVNLLGEYPFQCSLYTPPLLNNTPLQLTESIPNLTYYPQLGISPGGDNIPNWRLGISGQVK